MHSSFIFALIVGFTLSSAAPITLQQEGRSMLSDNISLVKSIATALESSKSDRGYFQPPTIKDTASLAPQSKFKRSIIYALSVGAGTSRLASAEYDAFVLEQSKDAESAVANQGVVVGEGKEGGIPKLMYNQFGGSGTGGFQRMVKRGADMIIEEDQEMGKQWEGAQELSDETDEPFW